MKKCPNNHGNPDSAKFCRICGYRFEKSLKSLGENILNIIKSKSLALINGLKMLINKKPSVFTPSLFPTINLVPCSVVSVDFRCKKGVVTMLVAFFLLVAFWYYRQRIEFKLFYQWDLPYSLHSYAIPIVYILIGIIFLVKFFPFMRRFILWFRYKLNVDYIESYIFMQDTYRIAKNGKLGLFDKNKKRVLLASRFSNITKFDSSHLLIERNGNKGLYSMKKSKIIVPVLYDRIEPFKNSIVKCIKGSNVTHYDINGNKMR